MKKFLFLIVFLGAISTIGFAQSDTTNSGYFLTFVKKVYLNPTVYLRTQEFKENTNLSFVALPDQASAGMNAPSGFEKGLQKILRFLMESDGGVRFYFDADTPTQPFHFWHTDNLWCKFKQVDIDSINYYLNVNFADGNVDMNNAIRFETSIDKALDYVEKCINKVPGECGVEPQNETAEINTKPLHISLHNRSNSKFDSDTMRYEQLEFHYAKAFDVHTQQNWYAPSKLLVPNEGNEPLALAIHSREGDFLKQNLKIELLTTHQVLSIDAASTEDSVFFSLPSSMTPGDPWEIVITYKSPKDSITYTVGFFMVNVMPRKTKNVVLISANNFVIGASELTSIEQELVKIYDPVGVSFELRVLDNFVFPSELPTTVIVDESNLLSNYADDLKEYVSEVKDLIDYDDDTYYLVVGLATEELEGYMPRARNIGFIFNNTSNQNQTLNHYAHIIGHELGHGIFHFAHIFCEEELGESFRDQTPNLMGYSPNPRELYLHQWNFIQDPAFVSWFGGDDEEGAAVLKQKIVLLELNESEIIHFSTNDQVNIDGFYTPSGFAVSFDDPEASNWEIRDIKIDKYSGGISKFTLNDTIYVGMYCWSAHGEFEFYCYIKSEELVKAKQAYIDWQVKEEKYPIDNQNISIGFLENWLKENKSSIPKLKSSDPGDNLILQIFTKNCLEYQVVAARIVLGDLIKSPQISWKNNMFMAPLESIRVPFYLESIYSDTTLGLQNFFASQNIMLLENNVVSELLCEYRQILSKGQYGSRFLEKFNFNNYFSSQLGAAFDNNGVNDYQRAKSFLKIARAYDQLDSNIILKIGNSELRNRLERILSYKFSQTGVQLTSLEQAEIYFNLLLKVQAEVNSYLNAIGNTRDEDYITYLITNLLDDSDLEKLSIEDRISGVKCLVSDWMWRNEEMAALRLLNTAPFDQSTDLLSELIKARTIYNAAGISKYKNIFTALYHRVTGNENKEYITVLFKLWYNSDFARTDRLEYNYNNKPMVFDYNSKQILGFYDSDWNVDKTEDFSKVTFTREIPSIVMNYPLANIPPANIYFSGVDLYNTLVNQSESYSYHPFQPIGLISIDQDGENIQFPCERIPAFLLYTFDDVNTGQNIRFASEIAIDIITTVVGVPPILSTFKYGLTAFKQLNRARKLVIGVKTIEFTSGAANLILKYTCSEQNTTCEKVQSFLTCLEVACMSGDAIYGVILKRKAKKLLSENMDQIRQLDDADEIEELIRKTADDVAELGQDFQKYLKKAISADADLASKIANTSFKTGDNFVDIIIHTNSAGEFIIKSEGNANKILSKTELAAIMNAVPASKQIRLLSCNDEVAAKELSGLVIRSFYASDGWVDVYQGGQVYSKNKFYKYQNGVKKTSESLPHNATAPSGLGNKVRLGVTWKYLPNGGTNSIDDILLGTGETVSYNKIVYNSMSVDDQIKLLAENVQGLTLEQAKFIIEFTKSRNAKVVFGGSRVRGNAKITSDWSTSSDLDLGFDGLTSGQRNSLINDFNKKFAGSSQNKIIEHNWIYPNSSPANIQQILSAEEFFMRSGIRSSYEGGKDFGPSGFISISSDGTVILGN